MDKFITMKEQCGAAGSANQAADAWVDLLKLLLQGRQETQPTFRHRSWPPLPNMERIARLKAEEAPHVIEVDRAIAWWLDRGHWPPFSAEEKYQTHLRFLAALMFLSQIVIGLDGDAPSTIVPFPQLKREAVARWMLADWWRAHGIELLCSLSDPLEASGEG